MQQQQCSNKRDDLLFFFDWYRCSYLLGILMGLLCFILDSIPCCFTIPHASRSPYPSYRPIASSTRYTTYNAIPQAWTHSSISDSDLSTMPCPSTLAKQFVYALNDDQRSEPCISTLDDEDYIPSCNPSCIGGRDQGIIAKPTTSNKLVINTFEPDNNMETTYFTRQPPSSNDITHTTRSMTTQQPYLPSSSSTGFSKAQISSSTTIDFDPLIDPFPNHVDTATHHNHTSSSTPSSPITKAVRYSKQKEIITTPAKGDDSFSRDSDQVCKAPKPTRNRKKKKKPAVCLSTKTRCVGGITVLYTKKTLPFKLKKYAIECCDMILWTDFGLLFCVGTIFNAIHTFRSLMMGSCLMKVNSTTRISTFNDHIYT